MEGAYLLGRCAEAFWELALKKHRHIIYRRNFKCLGGEVDIISLKQNTLFVWEVKFRSAPSMHIRSEIIDLLKYRRLKDCIFNNFEQFAKVKLRKILFLGVIFMWDSLFSIKIELVRLGYFLL